MDAQLSYSASVTVDGELREVAGNEAVEITNIITGSQVIGTTYEVLATTVIPQSGMVLYNTGDVDVSVRIRLSHFSINEYLSFNLIAGGVMFFPRVYFNDEGRAAQMEDIYARSASGTVTVNYCLLYT